MIYLDSAATTLQKPPQVAQAMARASGRLGSPGRGGHAAAMAAAETAFACRSAAAEFFQAPEPERVVFTSNATHALNIALRTLVHPGCTVLISGFEHNAVTRTLASIPGVRVRVAAGRLFQPDSFLCEWRDQLDGVDVAICNHVSNVFGYILPVEEAAALCRNRGVPFILDASQSAGCLPVSMRRLDAAFIAMPGHKGLYGPQGTGLLLCGLEDAAPIITGGTGSLSAQAEMPGFLPDRLEAGTHNMPGIAGLLEGIRFVQRVGPERILAHEVRLARQLAEGLDRVPGVEVFARAGLPHQAGVVSFRLRNLDVEEAGARLGQAGFAVRAGLHCAPLAHETAGTLESGTIRASLSAFNQNRDVEQFLMAVRRIARAAA